MDNEVEVDWKLSILDRGLNNLVGHGDFTRTMADGILETVTAVVAMSNTSTVQRDVTSTVAAAASVPIFRPEQPGTRLLRISYYNPNDEPVISEHPEQYVHTASAILGKTVYCPWLVTFPSPNMPGHCLSWRSHGFFSHNDLMGLPREALECPYWHQGRCRRPAPECMFAHFYTLHGQIAPLSRTSFPGVGQRPAQSYIPR